MVGTIKTFIEKKKRKRENKMIGLLKEGYSLNDLKYQNKTICEYAIEKSLDNVKFIKLELLTEDLILKIIRKQPFCIEFLKKQVELTEDIYLEAVNINGYVLREIENPTEEVILTAIKKHPFAIEYIKKPSKEVIDMVIETNPFAIKHIKNLSEEQFLKAIREEGDCIQYAKFQTDEMKFLAIQSNPNALKYIKNPTKEIQLVALCENGKTILYVKNPPEELQLIAIEQNPYAIYHIKNPTRTACLRALELNPHSISCFKNQTEEFVKIALRKDRSIKKHIRINFSSNDFKVFNLQSLDRRCKLIVAEKNKGKWIFSIGCQKGMSKETFIDRIYNTDGGLNANPYRKEYLKVLENF